MEREVYVLKKFFAATTILFFSIILASCNFGLPIFLYAEEGVEDRAANMLTLLGNDLPQINSAGKYSFIVLTDSHFGETKYERREESFLNVFKSLLQNNDPALRPSFIVNLGDTMDGGHSIEALQFNLTAASWIQLAKDTLGVSDYKVYSILGNHDLYNDGWADWRKAIYPHTSCYKFTLNAGGANPFDFFFLDSGNGTLGGNQIENLERELKLSPRPKIVFMHYPLYAGGIFYFALDDVEERSRLISDFSKNNVKYVFEGHKHTLHDYDFKKFKEIVVGAYLQYKTFGLVTVDENTSLVTFTRLYY